MDNFAEQLVKKGVSTADSIKKIFVGLGGIIIAVILVILSFLNISNILSILGLLAAVGVGYGTFFLVQSMYIEYEYTFTNGEMDIDKIIAKKKRKSLVSVNVKDFTAFGRYNENLFESSDMTVVISSDNIASHEYYADFQHNELGKARLVFSPDEKMLESIKKSLPRNLKNLL